MVKYGLIQYKNLSENSEEGRSGGVIMKKSKKIATILAISATFGGVLSSPPNGRTQRTLLSTHKTNLMQ